MNRIQNILKILLNQNVLILLFTFKSIFYEQKQVSTLEYYLDEYRNAVFQDIESLLDPKVALVVEKGCNFGIFDKKLDKLEIAVIRKIRGKLTVDFYLTETLLKGDKLPRNFRYALFSPFISFDQFLEDEDFYFQYTVQDRFQGNIKSTFNKIREYLENSNLNIIKNNLIEYSRVINRDYTLYRFKLEGLGEYIHTEYEEDNLIMKELLKIKKIIANKINKNIGFGKIINEITTMLLDMLKNNNIVDVGDELDLIPLLFPYKMLNPKYDRIGPSQIMTIGVDLSKLGKRLKRTEFNNEYYISFEF